MSGSFCPYDVLILYRWGFCPLCVVFPMACVLSSADMMMAIGGQEIALQHSCLEGDTLILTGAFYWVVF